MNRRTTKAWALAPLFVALAGSACNTDELIEVETPDIVTVESAGSPAGAQAFRFAAVGDFSRLIGGDRGGSSPLGFAIPSGMLADEIISARSGTEHMDNRAINPNSFPIDTWSQVGNTYGRIIRAIRLINQYAPAADQPLQLGELHAMKGYTLALTAEMYCNGVPFWKGVEGELESETLTTLEMNTRALVQFDSALTRLGTASTAAAVRTRNFVNVGKARTLLNMGRYAEAAAAAALVPAGFTWETEFSNSTASVTNSVYNWMNSTANFGAANNEGGNGLNFVSAGDPRIRSVGPTTRAGQDGSIVPVFRHYAALNSPIIVASYTEAQLIIAETELRDGNANWLTRLNALRSGATGMTLAPLTDPGDAAGRVNLLFRERAFWMYLTAHRLGDLRRLVRQYNRPENTVFPTGPYFKGGVYGTDVTLVPSQAETNNVNWYDPANGKNGCIDKNA